MRLFPIPSWTLALVGLIGLTISGGSAAASSVSAAPGAADSAGHDCRCGRGCRGASCCCSHGKGRSEPTPEPSRRVEPTPPGTAASPCAMKAAPCGETGAVTPSTVAPMGDAVLALGNGRLGADSERLGISPDSIEAPGQRADRLDDPPENLLAD